VLLAGQGLFCCGMAPEAGGAACRRPWKQLDWHGRAEETPGEGPPPWEFVFRGDP